MRKADKRSYSFSEVDFKTCSTNLHPTNHYVAGGVWFSIGLHWERDIWRQAQGAVTNMAHLSPFVTHIFMWSLPLSERWVVCMCVAVSRVKLRPRRKQRASWKSATLFVLRKVLQYVADYHTKVMNPNKELTCALTPRSVVFSERRTAETATH